MLDILHNGVTKKVNGSLKETEGLLIVSGIPTWTSARGSYVAMFVDPRIKPTHAIQSIKVTTENPSGRSTSDFTVDHADAGYGFVEIIVSDSTIIQSNSVITITMYDVTAVATPSGIPMSILGDVSFTDWKVDQIHDGIPVFFGTVAVKIEDDGISAPSLATVVDNSFTLRYNDGDGTSVRVQSIKEVLPDGRLVCTGGIEFAPGTEDPVFPSSASSAVIDYIYVASDNIRMTLPEADAEWVEQEGSSVEDHGVIFYEATFAAEVPASVHVNDVIVVHGENGEEFPVINGDGTTPKMYSYVTRTIGGAASIVVHWTRDTMPETTKLTAEVYVANYVASDGSAEQIPVEP